MNQTPPRPGFAKAAATKTMAATSIQAATILKVRFFFIVISPLFIRPSAADQGQGPGIVVLVHMVTVLNHCGRSFELNSIHSPSTRTTTISSSRIAYGVPKSKFASPFFRGMPSTALEVVY